ncbi:iron ABC transporter permease [Photobacterium sp. BZF1]|uniref:FecCD family ABC transporter permease n=1 Tax=Photobacterium sp. BZF1 TaxID=1904457 RepID=UPI001653BFB7|nr:iron ABC transporter permease [Photobacterium sp. BZF1]MBC7004644.1 iron ABC transporter permease [Photobacterium sp. BZF1]
MNRLLFPLGAIALLTLSGLYFISSGTLAPELTSAMLTYETNRFDPFWSLAVPRFVLALMAGALLSVSGYLLQTTLRNPLADSGVLGVNAGASLGAVCALLLPGWFGWGISIENALISFAITGGLLATIPTLLMSRLANPSLTLLTGVAITAILGAVSSALIFTIGQGRTDLALQWMAGGLYGRGWEQVAMLWPWFCLATILLLGLTVPLQWVRFEDPVLRGLGVNGPRVRLLLLALAAFITAPAIATVGPIGFIGLVIPHVAKLLTNHHVKLSLWLSALFGGIFLAAADWLGQTLFAPNEIPAGVVTALIGVPFFLILLRKNA